MPAPLFSAADYVAAFQSLLPRGRAWPRDSDATITQLLQGLAKIYERSNGGANQLLVDAFPATAYQLLGEWESTLGLPSRYSAAPTTTGERQSQVVAALTDTGGQSVAYFVGLAAKLGYAITITHFKPYSVRAPVNAPIYGKAWAHAWQINVSLNTVLGLSVESTVDESIAVWDNTALVAAINRYKPSHTIPILSYF
jgi:uncharacterized protein YmfQ (DUF2313 family)